MVSKQSIRGDAMRIDIVTLFPQACSDFLSTSIVGRAQRDGLVDINCVNPRDWTDDKHQTVDDRPFGGGPGMVLKVEPLAKCIDSIRDTAPDAKLIMTSAQGEHFTQNHAQSWSEEAHLIIVCGHYEGIDERFVELYQPIEVSIGDVVLSGGEIAALLVSDAIVRLLPGALGHADSAKEDSFSGDEKLLDHPSYTQPREFRGLHVPEILLSGDHGAIAKWRKEQRLKRTQQRRPDLLE